MKKKPVLVIMAAGMGSRYGGLKQIDPLNEDGDLIIAFSIFDAVRAGFEKIVFVIKKEIEADFKEKIGSRIEKNVEVAYVYQSLDNIPDGFKVPEGRIKPWGTGHAVLSCADVVDGPFAVINADDYYGEEAFRLIYNYLTEHEDDDKFRYAMVGYILENTLTDFGHVARGICETDKDGYLVDIHERTRIEKCDGGAAYTEDDGESWTALDKNSTVSMNMWGFSASFMKALKDGFPAFLEKGIMENPLKCEYFLPFVVDELIKADKATVRVLQSKDRWYGVTYKEDKPVVVAAVKAMKESGKYPKKLWV